MPTEPQRRPRACDRCSSLKTVCDRKNPCSRCQRVSQSCSYQRPVLSRGRPRKCAGTGAEAPKNLPLATDNDAASLSVDDPEATNVDAERTLPHEEHHAPPTVNAVSLVGELSVMPISQHLAAHILDRFFSLTEDIGILGAIRKNLHLLFHPSSPTESYISEPRMASMLRSPLLLYTFITIGLQLDCPPAFMSERAVLVDSLRVYALEHVPELTRRGQQTRIEDAYALSLLGSFGSFNRVSVEAAERWTMMASVIFRETLGDPSPEDPELEEFKQRSSRTIVLNDRTLALLHHRSPFAFNLPGAHNASVGKVSQDIFRQGAVSECLWHSGSSLDGMSSLLGAPAADMSFLDLIYPLIRPFDAALMKQKLGSKPAKSALDDLEEYYFNFPSTLLKFEDVPHLFQLECMIWFHGIYILMFGNWDLLDMLEDKAWHDSQDFLTTLEHALLIGEVLEAAMRFGSSLHNLYTGTVSLILSSAVVHVAALSVVVGCSSEPIIGVDKLYSSAQYHLRVLLIFQGSSFDYPLDIFGVIAQILQATLKAEPGHLPERSIYDGLKPYRWKGTGRGVVKANLTDHIAVGGESHRSGVSGFNMATELASLFDVSLRLCEPGYFDMSIRL